MDCTEGAKVCQRSITGPFCSKKVFQEQEKHLNRSLGPDKIFLKSINQARKSSDRSSHVTSQKLLSLSNVMKQH